MESLHEELYSYSAYVSLLIIGTIGNGLIIVYFTKTNARNLQKMSPYHFLLTCLAFADIIVSIGAPIFHINRSNWWSNKFICQYFNIFFDVTLPTYSVWILGLISYERYQKMVHPFKAPIRKKSLSVILLLLMLACTGLYILFMESLYMRHLCSSQYTITLDVLSNITPFLIGSFCIDCLFPSVLILWFYYQISKKVRSFNKVSKRLDLNQEHQFDNYARKKAALKTLRTLIVMYLVFIYPGRSCFVIIIFLSYNAPLLYNRNYISFNIILNSMEIFVYLNNMGNVFIYAWLIVAFRRFLKRIFTLRIFKRQTLNERSTHEIAATTL